MPAASKPRSCSKTTCHERADDLAPERGEHPGAAVPGGRSGVSGYDVSEIALKWATRLGVEFHPEIYGGDYEPPLSPTEVEEYEDDMEMLFSLWAAIRWIPTRSASTPCGRRACPWSREVRHD